MCSAPFRSSVFLTGMILAVLLFTREAFGEASPTHRSRPESAGPSVIFTDDFESGDLSAWSEVIGGPEPPACGGVLLTETFPDDGGSWPGSWTVAGGTDVADVSGGRGRQRPLPTNYSLARVFHPAATSDVEVRFTLVFEDVATQGVGFYVRQNGGYLQQTSPHGQGYAVFVEGFRTTPGIGVWREVDGMEQNLQILFDPALGLTDGVPYRVRFRVHQMDASTTLLQAKIWPEAAAEPFGWQVETTDATPSLQRISGGIAVDSWSSIQSPNSIADHTLVDDIEVVELCNPLAGTAAPTLVLDGFLFTEGPLWRGDHLLFTDLEASRIHRRNPPAGLSTYREPSQEANGLALDVDGDLLAAERNPPRISTDTGGVVTTLVDGYMGLAFNAPNDLVVRSDGVVYFTDPTFGMVGTPEIGFNGLYRLHTTLGLTAEWEGVTGVNEPNGVALSLDESRLFVADTQAGSVLAWDVAADGTLSNPRPLATSLTIPDGLCVDPEGNLWIATWAPSLEVYTPDGAYWGSLPVPQAATNCAFGGPDGRTLYVTAQTGLYSTTVSGG
ncbi:MAG: SMP-30/gluconolactonase/LRE family protein [Acidobacteria bacterium]|nr:SMP-30/gluconolactonase/LRE family protein [Acidobacteriota bacterium]